MSTDTSGKVTAARLRRDAYLYIRQSTLHQVANNTESTARQYDLRGRAVALGWPADRIHVIDIDQGHSGASSADREGFQHLVAEVSLGRAGIILGPGMLAAGPQQRIVPISEQCVLFRVRIYAAQGGSALAGAASAAVGPA